MLVIRFFRVGKKNQPSFKIVVTDKKNPPRSGRFVEEVGFYNPLTKEKKLKSERVKYWLSVGAKASPTVHNLLVLEKIIEGKKIDVHKKPKEKPVKEGKVKPSETLSEEKKEEKPVPKEEKPVSEETVAKTSKEEKPAELVKEEPKIEIKDQSIEETPKQDKKEEIKETEEKKETKEAAKEEKEPASVPSKDAPVEDQKP
ncbi:30S ribosomal protein S16 [Patescibacteria group bacterium]